MYEDLEPIASLKYGKIVELASKERVEQLSKASALFARRGLLQSGSMEAEKLRIGVAACERICRAVYEIWYDLITRRTGGRITREDLNFIMGKVEECAQNRARDLKSMGGTGVVPPNQNWVAQQGEMKMQAVASDIRRDLEIKLREHEAFDLPPEK